MQEEEVIFQLEAITAACIFRNYTNTFCISFQSASKNAQFNKT